MVVPVLPVTPWKVSRAKRQRDLEATPKKTADWLVSFFPGACWWYLFFKPEIDQICMVQGQRINFHEARKRFLPYHPWDDCIIYLHEQLIFMVNVGKYTSPIDPMGLSYQRLMSGKNHFWYTLIMAHGPQDGKGDNPIYTLEVQPTKKSGLSFEWSMDPWIKDSRSYQRAKCWCDWTCRVHMYIGKHAHTLTSGYTYSM